MNAAPVGWWAAAVAVVAGLSPLLAGWTVALESGVTSRWWQPRRSSGSRLMVTAGVAVVLAAAALQAAAPWPAEVILAAVGTVLALVDVRVHLLPARLVWPMAGALAVVLTGTAAWGGHWPDLMRAATAAGVVGGGWLVVAFLAPAAIGLGDVRLLAVTAAVLGWVGWAAVLGGQLLTFMAAGVTAVALALMRPAGDDRRGQVPMGPAIVVGTVLAGWLLG